MMEHFDLVKGKAEYMMAKRVKKSTSESGSSLNALPITCMRVLIWILVVGCESLSKICQYCYKRTRTK